MLDIVITLSSNLFRVYIFYRFMRLFFAEKTVKKIKSNPFLRIILHFDFWSLPAVSFHAL